MTNHTPPQTTDYLITETTAAGLLDIDDTYTPNDDRNNLITVEGKRIGTHHIWIYHTTPDGKTAKTRHRLSDTVKLAEPAPRMGDTDIEAVTR